MNKQQNTSIGARLPFLRWSFIRLILGMKNLESKWQVGDGREEAAVRFVLANSKAGDLDGAIQAIDEFAYKHKFLINVGDEKGELLDHVIERVKPALVLELGAYVGYSALRIARKLPKGGRLVSVEFSAANAAIARRVLAHAGVSDLVTVVTGYLGDGGSTLERLSRDFGFAAGRLDVVFIDHAKEAYLPDLQHILAKNWLRAGSVVVADNVRFPGAPEYQAYIQSQEGTHWKTKAHETHVEYQTMLKDVVLESTFLG